MISNPVKQMVSGNDSKSFVYEGGTKLYHFSPKANGLSRYMDCNVIFFADNKKHAEDVLRRMFEFVIACSLTFSEQYASSRHPEFKTEKEKKAKQFQHWLDELNAGNIKIQKAPTNQFYEVGWADNDTI